MKNTNQEYGDLGQYWTPNDIVIKMISLIKNNGKILEPSAGSGNFIKHLNNYVALEIDSKVITNKNVFKINFFDYSLENKFDTVIGNPPYIAGNILKKDWFSSWKGIIPKSANSYLHFIEKSIQHLNNNGELIFIVPHTFLSDTSRGRLLRKNMCKDGAFTHIIFPNNISWENAAVETVIFRWQKGKKQNKIKIFDKELNLFENNGFLWFINFNPTNVIGDFFSASVGSAPWKKNIIDGENSDNFDYYIKDGKNIKICEKNREIWPRKKDTIKTDKIFFLGGPTRKWPIFFYGTNPKHLDNVLLPKNKFSNIIDVTNELNDWFKKYGKILGLMKNGRWGAGIKQIESCPIDKNLSLILEKYSL